MKLLAGLALLNVQIVDADGVRGADALLIRGDRIEHIGARPDDLEGYRVIDLQGATVAPGLVDAHVHLSLTPSGAFLELTPIEEEALWRQHLAAYVACGVTTVLDTGILPGDAADMRQVAALSASPDIHFLGPLVSPPGGYVNVVLPQFPPAPDAAAVNEQIAAFAPLQPTGIKITVEEGMVTRIWPLYPPEVEQALIESGQPLYAHAMSRSEYWHALEIGVSGFVHPPQSPNRKLIEAVASKELPVITTLSAFDSLLIAAEPERLDAPLVKLTVPQVERRAAADPDIHTRYATTVMNTILPGMPGFVRKAAARKALKRGMLTSRVEKMQRAVRALHEGGVPLVMGSDSGNWPVFPFEFHGPTSLRELEVLQEAGIPAADVLTIATRNGARLLGMEAEIGTVTAGKRADLVVMDGNPAEDIRAYRSARFIVRAGEARTPAQWMGRP